MKNNPVSFCIALHAVWAKFTLQAKQVYKWYCEITVGSFTAMITKYVHSILFHILYMVVVIYVLQFHLLNVVTIKRAIVRFKEVCNPQRLTYSIFAFSPKQFPTSNTQQKVN